MGERENDEAFCDYICILNRRLHFEGCYSHFRIIKRKRETERVSEQGVRERERDREREKREEFERERESVYSVNI